MSSARSLEAIWREHRLALVSALAARLRDLDLAEDALSEAFLAAKDSWQDAIPSNPAGWLYRVALRKATDSLRKRARHLSAAPAVEADAMSRTPDTDESALPEARLGLFFHCAHPALAREAQIALILFHVAGLSAKRIATAFLTPESTIHQRLKRARDKLRTCAVPFEPPLPHAWPERLPPILSAIEIIYDQSYADTGGGTEANALGADALQLIETLAELLPGEAEVLGLGAMLEHCEARRPARLDAKGGFIPLREQDPRRWSGNRIRRASAYMHAASRSRVTSVLPMGSYCLRAHLHGLQAETVATGADRRAAIVETYDALYTLQPSPVVRVNRALALADLDGPAAGLAELDAVAQEARLEAFAPYHLARGELLLRSGDRQGAQKSFRLALPCLSGQAEIRHVKNRISQLAH